MHGCAVLFPDVAHEVPYWVDDVSLRQSIQSAADAATGATRQHKPPPQPTRASRRGACHTPPTPARLSPARSSPTLSSRTITMGADDST